MPCSMLGGKLSTTSSGKLAKDDQKDVKVGVLITCRNPKLLATSSKAFDYFSLQLCERHADH